MDQNEAAIQKELSSQNPNIAKIEELKKTKSGFWRIYNEAKNKYDRMYIPQISSKTRLTQESNISPEKVEDILTKNLPEINPSDVEHIKKIKPKITTKLNKSEKPTVTTLPKITVTKIDSKILMPNFKGKLEPIKQVESISVKMYLIYITRMIC